MSEKLNRIRAVTDGVAVEGVSDARMHEILAGGCLPTSLEYALIAEAAGRTVDWLLHGTERSVDVVACRAREYKCVDDEPDAHCLATFREDPMPDTVYCGEKGPHSRHTAWQGRDYYAWLDGDEGAGSDPMQ